VNGEDVLAFANTANITGSWNAATGVLTLTGADTVSAYQAALRSVTYRNTSDNLSTATRTISFSINDGALSSNSVTRDITIAAVNDAPVLRQVPNFTDSGQALGAAGDQTYDSDLGDIDGDGDLDLVDGNQNTPDRVYLNDGSGTFTDSGQALGSANTRQVRLGDLDGDGDLDAIVANLAHPRFWDFSSKTEVLINQGDGTFADIQGAWDFPAGAAGLRYQETHSVPALADFDQDGALDLVISAVYDGRPTDFYWGNGDGTFRLDAWRSGIGVTNGWGHATADVDLDGDVDLAAQGAVYLNQRAHAGHWLQVKVVGDVAANRAALGATVTVEAGGRRFVRFVGGGTGQGCQDSLYLHMGLGEAASVDRISVRFPGAAAPVVFAGPFDADQRLWLYESGNVQRGFAP
ncbi:MAG: VCBS repeat-containing protein, partial [Myxococcales bacterium]|nr:VCBS repeat-containing protein [Myxococcales bacterium]